MFDQIAEWPWRSSSCRRTTTRSCEVGGSVSTFDAAFRWLTVWPHFTSYYRNGDATHASWFAVVIAFFQVTDLILLFRRHKSPDFAEQLLDIVHALRIPSWPAKELSAQSIVIQKVSGSLTNAVFFVSCPSIPIIPVLLVRIYGPSSGSLISRPRELQTLHILSSRYHIGPRVYGTFENGRIEEYFHSVTLSAKDLCDPKISAWIGARMAELHQVDIAVVEAMPSSEEWNGVGIECTSAKRNIKSWLPAARDVLALPSVSDTIRRSFDLKTFEIEWNDYIRWIDEKEKQEVPSERVFAHNDTQYGNLLRSTSHKVGTPEHRQVPHFLLCYSKLDYRSPLLNYTYSLR